MGRAAIQASAEGNAIAVLGKVATSVLENESIDSLLERPLQAFHLGKVSVTMQTRLRFGEFRRKQPEVGVVV